MARAAQLSAIYYGDSTGAWRGPKALFDQAKEEGVQGVSLEECQDFLKSQPTYTLYRHAQRNYPRNTIQAYFCGEILQIDIMDMQKFRSENEHLYVLLAYDTYSKYLQGYPLFNRKPPSIIEGLKAFLRGPFAINSIYWDKEGSFLSRAVQGFLKGAGVHNYTTKSKVKAPSVERSIRTIRTAVQRYFEHSQTQQWEAFLPKFIRSYNRRRHSTTKLRPIDIVNDPILVVPLQPVPRPRSRRPVILPPIGSYVRLNRLRGIFDKEATGSYTEEVFRVIRHKYSKPIPMIFVADLMGDPLSGALYPAEYQPITFDGTKEVDTVLKTRKRKNHAKEYFVSFRGYPPKFNAWVNDV